MKVLHLIDTVKPNAIPWFYNLINNLPQTENILSSWGNEGIVQGKFSQIEYPYQQKKGTSLLFRLLNKVISIYRNVSYSRFVKNNVGNVDMIHAHFAHVGWQDIELKKMLNVPYIVSFYGYDYESIPYKYPVWKKRYQELFSKADIIIAEGNFGASKLVEIGCPENKVRVCHLGVEADKIPFAIRQKNKSELKLLQIAAIREKKGQKYTIKAFLKALSICPNMTLTIVGEDQDAQINYFKSLIPISHKDKIKFIDRIDFSAIYQYLEDFQVFIHPSCYSNDRDCEGGAPIVLLDAQATGMPIISTAHCDIPDEVSNGNSGLLTIEKDISKLSESIERFYNMGQKEFTSFSENAKNHVCENYDINKTGVCMKAIYDSLI